MKLVILVITTLFSSIELAQQYSRISGMNWSSTKRQISRIEVLAKIHSSKLWVTQNDSLFVFDISLRRFWLRHRWSLVMLEMLCQHVVSCNKLRYSGCRAGCNESILINNDIVFYQGGNHLMIIRASHSSFANFDFKPFTVHLWPRKLKPTQTQ